MRMILACLAAIPFACLCRPAAAQAAASGSATASSVQTHTETIHISGTAANQTYADENGKAITKAAFAQAIKDGRHFKVALSPDHKRLVLSLLPPGAKGNQTALMMGGLPQSNLHVGQPMPPFSLPTAAGGTANTASLAGAPTLVDFFFADCVACIEELPAMNAYRAAHPHMHYLAITFDDAKTARAFVAKRHFAWPVAYGHTYVMDQAKVRAFPTLLLLDARGRIVASRSGGIPVSWTPPKDDPHAQPDAAAANASQLAWLDDWVKQQLAAPPH